MFGPLVFQTSLPVFVSVTGIWIVVPAPAVAGTVAAYVAPRTPSGAAEPYGAIAADAVAPKADTASDSTAQTATAVMTIECTSDLTGRA